MLGLFKSGTCTICGNTVKHGLEKLGKDRTICPKCIYYAGGIKGLSKISPRTVDTIRAAVSIKAPRGYFTEDVQEKYHAYIEKKLEASNPLRDYVLSYDYENVDIFSPKRISLKILNDIEGQNVYFEQEPDNKHDSKAVKVIFYGEDDEITLGYLYRGIIQDMVNDYIDRGWKIYANVNEVKLEYDSLDESYIYEDDQRKGTFISIDIDFYKPK